MLSSCRCALLLQWLLGVYLHSLKIEVFFFIIQLAPVTRCNDNLRHAYLAHKVLLPDLFIYFTTVACAICTPLSLAETVIVRYGLGSDVK